MAGQGNITGFQQKTEELSKQYNDMLNALRHEKDKEIQSLRVSSPFPTLFAPVCSLWLIIGDVISASRGLSSQLEKAPVIMANMWSLFCLCLGRCVGACLLHVRVASQSQLIQVKTEYSTQTTGDRSLGLRITELLTKLEQRESLIKRQEEVRDCTPLLSQGVTLFRASWPMNWKSVVFFRLSPVPASLS